MSFREREELAEQLRLNADQNSCVHLVAHCSDGSLVPNYLIELVMQTKEYARFSFCPRCGEKLEWMDNL